MKYRIVIETEQSGKKWYYVQKRSCFYFWSYLSDIRDIPSYAYKIGFSTLKEAEECIQHNTDCDYKEQQRKIVKKEIYKKEKGL